MIYKSLSLIDILLPDWYIGTEHSPADPNWATLVAFPLGLVEDKSAKELREDQAGIR